MVHFDDRRPEFTPYGLTCERWEPKPMPRPDRHNEVELNLLDGGFLTYLIWGERVSLRGGRLAAFWAAIPHQIVEFGDVNAYHVVTVPLVWVLNWNLPGGLVQRLLQGDVIQESRDVRASSDAALLDQWIGDLEQGRVDHQEVMLLELEARLARLALGAGPVDRRADDPPPPASTRETATKAERMARFVAQGYREPIHIADVARSVGLHPDYAATLFRKTFGTTLNRFLLDHRIQHAQRMLVTTDEKVLTVALESGFHSLSRFNAAFKQLCGSTPREYRRSHRP